MLTNICRKLPKKRPSVRIKIDPMTIEEKNEDIDFDNMGSYFVLLLNINLGHVVKNS